MPQALRIVGWDKNFESNETRKRKNLKWVKLSTDPNARHYRIMSAPNGYSVMGVYYSMVQIAAQCGRRDGLLIGDNAQVYDARLIAELSGGVEKAVAEAIEILTGPKIGLLEYVDSELLPKLKNNKISKQKTIPNQLKDLPAQLPPYKKPEQPKEKPDRIVDLDALRRIDVYSALSRIGVNDPTKTDIANIRYITKPYVERIWNDIKNKERVKDPIGLLVYKLKCVDLRNDNES
jgi:hypothetical protein